MLLLLVLALQPSHASSCENASSDVTQDMSNLLAWWPTSTSDVVAALNAGDHGQAKKLAHIVATSARLTGKGDVAENAGKLWQVADMLEDAQSALEDGNWAEAKRLAAEAAALLRELVEEGLVSAEEAEAILAEAGELWTAADKAAKKAQENMSGAPMLDQWRFDHDRGPVFCGVATAIMMLQANGVDIGTSYSELNAVGNRMYWPSQGTSGADMAAYLRERGLKGSSYTTQGNTQDVLETLQKGQVVPLGVLSSKGQVVALNEGGSANHPHTKVGDTHDRTFGPSGHWVLVVGTEGDPNNPSAYLVNDPDLGGQVRVTPAELAKMAAGDGNFWMVHQ